MKKINKIKLPFRRLGSSMQQIGRRMWGVRRVVGCKGGHERRVMGWGVGMTHIWGVIFAIALGSCCQRKVIY